MDLGRKAHLTALVQAALGLRRAIRMESQDIHQVWI